MNFFFLHVLLGKYFSDYAPKNQLEGDTSVMTYRGHRVLQTLIRCHFSPAATTGQRYIYTGCSTGRVISKFLKYRLYYKSKQAKEKNRRYVDQQFHRTRFLISVYDLLTGKIVRNLFGHEMCVRDVSWHPFYPHIVSTSVSKDYSTQLTQLTLSLPSFP